MRVLNLLLVILCITNTLIAQNETLLFYEDFGFVTETLPESNALPEPNVLLHEFTNTPPIDGQYAVATSSFLTQEVFGFPISYWGGTNAIGNVDADGNINGRFLSINLNTNVKTPFYRRTLATVQEKDYIFRIHLAGLCDQTCDIQPNFTIQIEESNNNLALTSINSTNVDVTNNDEWINVEIPFSSNNTQQISLVLINNQTNNENGNDIGIDNISLVEINDSSLNIKKSEFIGSDFLESNIVKNSILFKDKTKITNIRLFDLKGSLLSTNIDISTLNSGVYILSFNFFNNTYTSKVIKI